MVAGGSTLGTHSIQPCGFKNDPIVDCMMTVVEYCFHGRYFLHFCASWANPIALSNMNPRRSCQKSTRRKINESSIRTGICCGFGFGCSCRFRRMEFKR
nr:hypothetical protein Iba_chr14dCG1730 [Ipomoea batatas]